MFINPALYIAERFCVEIVMRFIWVVMGQLNRKKRVGFLEFIKINEVLDWDLGVFMGQYKEDIGVVSGVIRWFQIE